MSGLILQHFDRNCHPEDAAAAAAACREAAETCRTTMVHANGAAESALVTWTGTARDQFVEVAADGIDGVRGLAAALEDLAADIEAAVQAAAVVRQGIVDDEVRAAQDALAESKRQAD